MSDLLPPPGGAHTALDRAAADLVGHRSIGVPRHRMAARGADTVYRVLAEAYARRPGVTRRPGAEEAAP